jgi:pimeloyl-ACP methyl ester carboxylesterase
MSPVPRDFMMSLCETAADRAKLRPLFDDWCKKKGASWIESYLDDTVSIPTKALKGVSEMWMYTSMSEEASRTSQPTLVLIGIYDPVYSLEFQKDQTLQALPAAKISMIDSGHFMPLELPEQLAKEIDDFLKS